MALYEESQTDTDLLPSAGAPPPRQKTHWKELEPERRTRIVLTITAPLLITTTLLCATLMPQIKGYQMISFMLCTLVIIWMALFVFFVLSFDHLHHIRIKRMQLPSARHIFIPYGYEEFENIPLLSVSAISAMRGSNAERLFVFSMYSTFGLVLSAVFMRWTEVTTTIDKVELILLLIAAYGAFLIPTWSLERSKNNLANSMHYFASSLALILGPLSFCLNQHWSALSVILMVICYCGFVFWISFSTSMDKEYDDLNKVHRISLISLLSEIFVLFTSYLTFILFVFCMAQDTIL